MSFIRFVVRALFRLAVIAAAALGAKTLYDRYWPRVKSLRGPAKEFVDHAGVIVEDTAARTQDAAREVAGAAKDAAADLQRAADDATDEATRRLTATTEEP
jgi:hypothetical protein